jgi:hypothetical protein
LAGLELIAQRTQRNSATAGRLPEPLPRSPVLTAPLAFAGLLGGWRNRVGETPQTFAKIITAANADTVVRHDRTPVALHHGDRPPIATVAIRWAISCVQRHMAEFLTTTRISTVPAS